MNILLVALWVAFVDAILNYLYGHELEECFERKAVSEHKSRSLRCYYHKSSTSRKREEEKVDIYFKTIKRKCTVSPYCPHSPNPYSVRMSATSRKPRRAHFPVTFTGCPLRQSTAHVLLPLPKLFSVPQVSTVVCSSHCEL